VRNFCARVEVTPAARVTIRAGGTPVDLPGMSAVLDQPIPSDVDGLERLSLAAIRRFAQVLHVTDPLREGLAVRCTTTVPRQVGLAGSSAVIIATMRALSHLWGARIGNFELAEMALATEVQDLGIAAGPMDRVIQAYEQVMMLDLAPPRREEQYVSLVARSIPPLLVAWDPGGGRSSDLTHSDLRARWLRGDDKVVGRGVAALERADAEAFADLVDHNFDLRCRVTTPTERDRQMVGVARGVGAAAKLCGSGGAIVAAPRRGVSLTSIEVALTEAGFLTCRPAIA
jgi:glucuronokinase